MSLPVVTLYGRPGCGLCDEAEQLLSALAARLGFALEVTNIEDDPGLERRYLFEIPVISLAGEELARAPIRAATLEARLREALPSR